MSEYATTGDGILTALHVLERMAATGQSLQALASVMTRLPQVLVNVPDVDKARADEDAVARGRASPRRRPRSATPAGSCCAPRAPSRWCG